MANRVLIGRLALTLVVVVLSATAVANAQGLNSFAGQNAASPAPTGTSEPSHGGETVVTGTVQAVDGSMVTVDGVQYTLTDPQALAGLQVGDTVTIKLETGDNGAVTAEISHEGEQQTAEPTEVNNGTQEPGDDHSGMTTQQPGDDHSGMATQQPSDDNSGMTTQQPGGDNPGMTSQQPGEDHGGMATQQPGGDQSNGSAGGTGGDSSGGANGGSGGGHDSGGQGDGSHDGGGDN